MQLGAATPCLQARRLSARPLRCSEALMAPYLNLVYGRQCQRGSWAGQRTQPASSSTNLHIKPSTQCAALLGTTAHTGLAIKEATAVEVQARLAEHISTKPCSTKPQLLVMFTATWCGPCSLVMRELQRLVALRRKGSLNVLVVDVDQDANKDFASQLGIASLPTLVFVGQDSSKRSICTVGHVSSRLIADVLDTKMDICGADLGQRLRLS